MSPVTIALVVLAAAAVYALVCLVSPTRRCPKCGGNRVRRRRACPRCRGRGRVRRPGATAVHRFAWSVLGDRFTERRKAASKEERGTDEAQQLR